MKNTSKTDKSVQTKDYNKMVKGLQIVSGLFMLAMVVLCIILLKKYNINIKNLGEIQNKVTGMKGGEITFAVGMILFSIIKSFALVFPPAVLFALSGLIFESIWIALLVNAIATALSLSLPYFLGRFTGKPMFDTLKNRFPKISKLDDFAGENEFAFVLILKVSGLLASDLSSLIFGTMNVPYRKYMIAANLGLLPLNIVWTLLGAKGDLSNPLTFLYILPIILFAVGSFVGMKWYTKKKQGKNGTVADSKD
ncbi:MAG: VTT domain-containing protein [Clostridiales bacterium]|nr:VTT domain-containing protein [Clostridiales bacterium]